MPSCPFSNMCLLTTYIHSSLFSLCLLLYIFHISSVSLYLSLLSIFHVITIVNLPAVTSYYNESSFHIWRSFHHSINSVSTFHGGNLPGSMIWPHQGRFLGPQPHICSRPLQLLLVLTTKELEIWRSEIGDCSWWPPEWLSYVFKVYGWLSSIRW